MKLLATVADVRLPGPGRRHRRRPGQEGRAGQAAMTMKECKDYMDMAKKEAREEGREEGRRVRRHDEEGAMRGPEEVAGRRRASEARSGPPDRAFVRRSCQTQ